MKSRPGNAKPPAEVRARTNDNVPDIKGCKVRLRSPKHRQPKSLLPMSGASPPPRPLQPARFGANSDTRRTDTRPSNDPPPPTSGTMHTSRDPCPQPNPVLTAGETASLRSNCGQAGAALSGKARRRGRRRVGTVRGRTYPPDAGELVRDFGPFFLCFVPPGEQYTISGHPVFDCSTATFAATSRI